jgi:HrpA-like RNA helicase
MIRPFQKNAASNEVDLEEKLSKMVLSKEFLDNTGVIFEYYMRVFGWPDFIVSLFGPNEGLLKQAILQIRRECTGIVTSTIVGACPEDQYFRVAEFRSKNLENRLVNFEEKSAENGSNKAFAKAFSLEEAKNYIKWHKALLNIFSDMINQAEEDKNYLSGLELDKNLFKTLLNKVFLEKKSYLSEKEKDAFSKENT